MKISRITVWQLELPLSEPYWLSGGRLKFERLDSTFIRIDTDEGLSGWGEGCPWGHTYLPAHGPGIRAAVETLASALLGQNPCSLHHINRIMDVTLPGHLYAKSAIDIACWDILGQSIGMPLWQIMGADKPEPVFVNSSISTGTPEEMVERIGKTRLLGYKTHSAKVGGTDLARDIARIEMISSALLDGESVTFDVNRAWTPAVAIQVLNSVKAKDWIEQPCETLDQCHHVAHRVANPIMLDECLHTFNDHLATWKRNACEGVKVKPNRVGGLTKAKQICDFGVSVGWQMHIEEVGGSALADTAAIHLASSIPQENRLASWLSHYHLAVDPVPGQGSRNHGGMTEPPETPGIGVRPNPDQLGQPCALYE